MRFNFLHIGGLFGAAVTLLFSPVCQAELAPEPDTTGTPNVALTPENKGVKFPDTAYQPYMEMVERLVKSHWNSATEKDSVPESTYYKVATQFSIRRDGGMESLHILTPSGFPQLDIKALESIKASAPFPALPDWCTEEDIPIQFIFQPNFLTIRKVQDVAYQPYMKEVRRVIKRQWTRLLKQEAKTSIIPRVSNKVVIQFNILRNGSVDSASVFTSSGLPPMDALALTAVHQSGPFPAFPSWHTEATIPIRFSFDYNVRK